MRKIKMRKGAAMIELIFAIVVMAIVFMSAPMLISTATKSGYVAMLQAPIAAASSEIGMILTRHWDEGDTDINKTAPILVAAGDIGLNAVVDPVSGISIGRRAGTPLSSKRSFFTSTGGTLNASTNFTAEGDFDDIDDYNGNTSNLKIYNSETTSAKIGDYVDINISIQTTVAYAEDNSSNGAAYLNGGPTLTYNNPFGRAAAGTSNIKSITVRLTTTNPAIELDKTIILNAFSCNIGTYELNRKSFP